MATRVRRGEIWLARLDPAQGYEIKKTRPVLIVQNDTLNAHSSMTIAVPLTTQGIERCYPNEALLTGTNDLPRTSKALLNHVRAIDQRRLLKRLGTITIDEQAMVDDALRITLGLTPID